MCRVDSAVRSQSLLFKSFPVHHSPVILHSRLCGLRYRESLKLNHKKRRVLLVTYFINIWATRWTFWGSNTSRGERFRFSQTVQTSSGTHSIFDSLGTGVLCSGGLSDLGVKLTTHFHLVPTLRMIGAVSLLPHMSRARVIFLFISDGWDFNLGEGQFVLSGLPISYTLWYDKTNSTWLCNDISKIPIARSWEI